MFLNQFQVTDSPYSIIQSVRQAGQWQTNGQVEIFPSTAEYELVIREASESVKYVWRSDRLSSRLDLDISCLTWIIQLLKIKSEPNTRCSVYSFGVTSIHSSFVFRFLGIIEWCCGYSTIIVSKDYLRHYSPNCSVVFHKLCMSYSHFLLLVLRKGSVTSSICIFTFFLWKL